MSFAASTILFLIFLLPGFVFRRFYFSEEFSKENVKQTFLESFLFAFVPSLILQSVWYFLSHIIYHGVNLVLIGRILSGVQCDACYEQIQLNAGSIFTYNFSILIFAGLSGFVGKQIVRKLKWDRKYKYFRFQNVWHYILTGEFFDFPRAAFELTDKVSTIEMVFVDALVETHEGSIIYTGILVDYELNKESGLDFITLKRVKRRFLVNDKNGQPDIKKEDQYYEIPGHVLVIRNDQLINLNFTYYKLTVDAEIYSIEAVS